MPPGMSAAASGWSGAAREGAEVELSPNEERPYLRAKDPVHVVLRVIGAVGDLRRRCVYRAIREATLTTARRENVRIVHLSNRHRPQDRPESLGRCHA